MQRQTVNIWLQRYRVQGDDGVLYGCGRRRAGARGCFTAEEAGQVQG